jgi:hypothetical protein
MPRAAFDPFGGVIANATTMAIGFHALAIQNRRCRLGSFVVGFPDKDARSKVRSHPGLVLPHSLTLSVYQD